MKCITRLLLALPLIVLTACGDRSSFAGPDPMQGPMFALVSRPGFHFLPPVGSAASSSGFLGDLSPTVRICEWIGGLSGTSCAGGTLLAEFTSTSGTGGAVVRVTDQNSYHVNWDTDDSVNPIVLGKQYQIVVLVGGRVMGTADVEIYANQGQAKNSAGDVITLVNGRTLPISFGITIQAILDALGFQPDALASGDFVVETVNTTDDDQRVETPSGDAAFEVDGEDVQVPGGGTQFELVIFERAFVDGKCVATYNGPQQGGCYEYKTLPAGVTFFEGGNPAQPAAVVGICGPGGEYVLAKDDNGVITFPPPFQPSIVDCSGFALSRLPRALRGLARLLLPSPLYAGDEGESGTVGAFSTLFWAAPVDVEANPSSPNPTGPFGPGTVVPLSFRVTTTHVTAESPTPVPAAGVTVDFTVSTGGGTLSTLSAITDVNGVVNVNWTLPATAGTYTVTAAVNGTGLPETPSHSASATVMVFTTYSGLDAGAGPTDARPNSDAAAASFDAAASTLGTLKVETFETAPTGFFTDLVLTDITVSQTGLVSPGGIYVDDNVNTDNVRGYNTTSGGTKRIFYLPPLGTPGITSATFTPNVPLQAWGAYFTGVGTIGNTTVQVIFDDGVERTFVVPGDANGGATFFGFTDPGRSIASVMVKETQTTGSRDIFSIDDVRFVAASAASAIAGSAALRSGMTLSRKVGPQPAATPPTVYRGGRLSEVHKR